MTQITRIHEAHLNSRNSPDMSLAFEARYCGGTAGSHAQNVQKFLADPAKHVDTTKPRMWQDRELWCCQLDTVRGTGTTQEAAWSQMWAILKITHPWLTKPGLFPALEVQ